MGILRTLERVRTRRKFNKLVPPELIAKLEKSGEPRNTIETKHFQFVVVNIEEKEPGETPATIGKIADSFSRHRVAPWGVESSLVIGYLGVPFPQDDSAEARMKLVTALLAENGDRIRIAHGQCSGKVGNFGADRSWRYGAIIPGFTVVLKKLLDIPFGSAIEIP